MNAATQKTNTRLTTKTPVAKKPAITKPLTQKPVTTKSVVKKVATKPAQAVKAAKPVKAKKAKLVRDSFTIPKDEYLVIDQLKIRASKLGQTIKKSELLRAGIKALAALGDAQFKAAVQDVPIIKTGRPKSPK